MKVRWTDTARAHLRAIHAYIARDSKLYADRTVDRLTRRSQQIARSPHSGRVVPEYEDQNVRELIEGSYRLIYQFLPDRIEVLAVVHTRRDLKRVDFLTSS